MLGADIPLANHRTACWLLRNKSIQPEYLGSPSCPIPRPAVNSAARPDCCVHLDQVLGPFYPIVQRADAGGDLTRIAGRPGRAGLVLNLMGRVLTTAGVPGARRPHRVLAGQFPRPLPPPEQRRSGAGFDPNFEGFAVLTADSEGRYSVKTIKPAAYQVAPGRIRPARVHFDVLGHTKTNHSNVFPGRSAQRHRPAAQQHDAAGRTGCHNSGRHGQCRGRFQDRCVRRPACSAAADACSCAFAFFGLADVRMNVRSTRKKPCQPSLPQPKPRPCRLRASASSRPPSPVSRAPAFTAPACRRSAPKTQISPGALYRYFPPGGDHRGDRRVGARRPCRLLQPHRRRRRPGGGAGIDRCRGAGAPAVDPGDTLGGRDDGEVDAVPRSTPAFSAIATRPMPRCRSPWRQRLPGGLVDPDLDIDMACQIVMALGRGLRHVALNRPVRRRTCCRCCNLLHHFSGRQASL